MKTILLAAAATLGLAGAASAADLSARMPLKAAPVAPVFSWTGCYVGGHVGGGFSRDANTTAPYQAGGAPPYGGFGYGIDSSFMGGGTLGCNWQPTGSPVVLGMEGELGYLSLKGSGYDPLAPAFAAANIQSSTRVGDWYGLVTGRLGYTSWDHALFYVKGGIAFVDVESSVAVTDLTVAARPTYYGTAKDGVATWTLGGGIEWALDLNWSVKAEYLYIAVDKTQSPLVAIPGGTVFGWNNDVGGVHTAKLGLNYRFGTIGGPLLAKY